MNLEYRKDWDIMNMLVMGEKQKKEIETIKKRKITVKLSDADCGII